MSDLLAPSIDDDEAILKIDTEKIKPAFDKFKKLVKQLRKSSDKLFKHPEMEGHVAMQGFIGDAEDLIKVAKAQVNQRALVLLTQRANIRNIAKGGDLRKQLGDVWQQVKDHGMIEKMPKTMQVSVVDILATEAPELDAPLEKDEPKSWPRSKARSRAASSKDGAASGKDGAASSKPRRTRRKQDLS